MPAGFAFPSDFASGFVSGLLSDFVSGLLSVFSAGRLSVLYQPDPLKTIAAGTIRRRGFFPHFGHFWTGSSLYDCTREKAWPQ